MKKQTALHPKDGGWIATTFEDPETILNTIWKCARLNYTGLEGFLPSDENILEFSGIRIRKKVDWHDPQKKDTELLFEITDIKNIQPEFLELWDYLVANHKVFGKVTTKQRETILKSIPISSAVASKEKSKYKGVDQRHEALWRMIKQVVEGGGTKEEMRDAILAKKKIGKKEDAIKKIRLPSNGTLQIIIDKFHKK